MEKELDLILQEFNKGNMCLDTLKAKLLLLFSVSKCTCETPSPQTHWENNVIKWTCFKCKKPT